jgi:hypothetical protein
MAAVIEKEVKTVKTVEKRDIVAYLLENLDQRPTDILDVTQVFGPFYRVNWLKPVHYKDSILATFKMRKSQFIRVEETGDDVKIDVKSNSDY